MRLQHSAGHLGAGVFAGRSLKRPFGQAASDQFDDSGRVWDPVKAAGGFGLIAILLASVWTEWQLAKWIYSLFV